jgi:hypothetical protein
MSTTAIVEAKACNYIRIIDFEKQFFTILRITNKHGVKPWFKEEQDKTESNTLWTKKTKERSKNNRVVKQLKQKMDV